MEEELQAVSSISIIERRIGFLVMRNCIFAFPVVLIRSGVPTAGFSLYPAIGSLVLLNLETRTFQCHIGVAPIGLKLSLHYYCFLLFTLRPQRLKQTE